ncbi:MAG TPA: flagellar hook protein FlgE [Sulfuricurvum sp.]|nr:MAG: flagellar hook protein FlgE [Campylobacterales bacterium 16-40-21]OZA03173.1 MAG: flagellar hook protein FlgE [Sulfuricurvum sp. 17-40-25]HQS67021.1 flagellar hook protein FlgE [Sulfuricurvum sp.]HQT35961.1 flagellar hook protein FlgE [Sulfuricurvum sp.]
MLRSLFAGVTGLQAHQIAMDVESNNIANVNTIGFKYSRANFSDLLAQTAQIATAPQGDLGGKNAVQIGLGTTINSVTRIMTQGSIQNTDKNTDVAIQGDGFFIVSSDAGSTYKYSRSGDFKFDAGGNFVDNGGFIVQGWVRDETTGKVDSTAPITNINIPPGLTTPANPSAVVTLKANLDSGETVETFNPTNEMATYNLTDYLAYVGGAVTPQALTANAIRTANTDVSEDMKVMFNEQGRSMVMQAGQGVWISYKPAVENATITNVQGAFSFDLNGTTISGTTPGTIPADNAGYIAQQINAKTALTGVVATVGAAGALQLTNDNSRASDLDATKNIRITAVNAGATAVGIVATVADNNNTTAYNYTYASNAVDLANNAAPINTTFRTTEQLRIIMQEHAQLITGGTGIEVVINDEGQYKFTNNNDGDATQEDLKLQVTAYSSTAGNITKNVRFTEVMQAIDGTLIEGSTGIRLSQSLNAATHSASIDIYDSLGSKHTLKMDFRKTGVDAATGATWSMKLSVPAPGEINTIAPLNEISGQVSFGPDGSLSSYTPTNVNYTGNNGSSPNQNINIDLGTSNAFDGITSFDATSGTSGISQDGFPGGDIVGIRIDQSGTLIGSFSNGRSFGLAQIGMAKFTNNEGLVADGGNVFLQSANSGDPIIGTAATAGRGFMQSSALEASNVDLSKSLTNLIIIQRGYQANGKTITTSDTLLETLLGIKR